MKAVKVRLCDAQLVKKKLIETNALDTSHMPDRDSEHIYFPLAEGSEDSVVLGLESVEIVEREMPEKRVNISLNDRLAGFLNTEELALVGRSQEVVGDIMIIEVDERLIGKEKEIASAFLESNKQVNVVVKKSAIHSGQFRTRGVEVLAGEDRKDTTHLESGVRLYLHLEKSYFSARLGSERLRIAKLVKKGERVLVMFSGSAPYPLVLAKHTQASKIVGIELNPDAHAFAVKNREKNKVSSDRVKLINGDVQVEVPRLIAHGEEKEGGFTKFDRVLMPLPKTSEEFLGDALPVVRPGGMIHLYAFLNEKEIDDEGKRIVNLCEEMGFTLKLDKVVKCGQHAPYTFRVCYDLIVS